MQVDYFEYVYRQLSHIDLDLLTKLHESEADAKFKALLRGKLGEKTGLSKAILDKTITRLTAMCFIEEDTTSKERAYYVTQYGIDVLLKLERELSK